MKKLLKKGIFFLVFIGIFVYLWRDSSIALYPWLAPSVPNPIFPYTSRKIEVQSNELKLQGALYMPAGEGPFPGIVLAHGATQLGRQLALYIIMSRKLAEKGYVVVNFDFRGFGQSDKPKELDALDNFDFIGDLAAVISYLTSLPKVDKTRVNLVGHSFGGGIVLSGGIQDERIHKIVSISPPRRVTERFFNEIASDIAYLQERLTREMSLKQPLPEEVVRSLIKQFAAEIILDYPIHPPVLLIDGALEPPEDLSFLHNIYLQMTEPKDYITISNATHYFGTHLDDYGLKKGLVYKKAVMAELIDTIDNWLNRF